MFNVLLTLEEISKTVSVWSFEVWFETLEIVDIKENILVLTTPTERDCLDRVGCRHLIRNEEYDYALAPKYP